MSTEIDIDVIKGCEGDSVYINETRVAGSKPWGGGRNILHLKTKVSNILNSIPRADIERYLNP